MNAIIYSPCRLMSFSFDMILKEVMSTAPYYHSPIIIQCYTAQSIIKNINHNSGLVLLDVTELHPNKVFSLLVAIRAFRHVEVILFCDKYADVCHFPVLYRAVLYRNTRLPIFRDTINQVCTRTWRKEDTVFNLDKDHQVNSMLTPREKEILHWIVMGLNNTQIANILAISYKTVSGYRRSICRKYGINSLNVYCSKYNQTPLMLGPMKNM